MTSKGFAKVVLHLDPDAIDAIPLGVMRVDRAGRIVYANSAVQRLMGPRIDIGARFQELEFAPGSQDVVEANLERRFGAHEASDYKFTIVHPDRTHVHAEISGVPEYDAAGDVVGAIGFVTDKTMDRANLAIHSAISSASDWRDLLSALDNAVRDVLAFDTIMVNLISVDRSALRSFYERPHVALEVSPAWRWWPMPAFVRADLDTILTTRPDDITAMFTSPPYSELAESEPATREWLRLGYRHMLRKPVMRDGRIIALVALLRLEDRPFTQADVDRIEQLPIGETIHIALALENHNELEFTLQLINRLGSVAESISEVGTVLVEEIRRHFEWEHVSLFRVNYDNSTISMVHQSAGARTRLPEGYTQSGDTGLLGTVVRSGKPVRTGDVRRTPGYVEGIESTSSEMCLPIPGDRVRWILNVESSLGSAFAAEEQALVERLLAVAGLILDRTLAIEFNKTVLECSADGVIQTTTQGQIQYVNPACAEMLKRSPEALVGMHLSTFVTPASGGDAGTATAYLNELMRRDTLAPTKVRFSIGEREQIPVLLSGNALPAQIGGRVYVASDLSYQEHVQRMDALQTVFRQVASESRVPLALTMSFLNELRERSLDSDSADLVERSIAHLRRTDLPLERMVRLAAAPEGQELPLQPAALSDVAAKVVHELPATHRRQISLSVADGATPVLAALPELEFCAASIIAFLLRMKAQRDRIGVDVRRESGNPVLDFALVDLSSKAPSATRLEPRSEHERDFALAQPVIQNLMERMRGGFEITQREGLRLRLIFKAAETS
jgi:PAS domain S-box-containing protein